VSTEPLQVFGISSWHRHWVAGQRAHEARVPCGTCTLCCRCWDEIPLTPAEARRLEHRQGKTGPALPHKDNGECVHLQIDGRCAIYDTRPNACRLFDCRVYLAVPERLISTMTPTVRALQANAASKFALVLKEPSDHTFADRVTAALTEVSRERIGEPISATTVLRRMR